MDIHHLRVVNLDREWSVLHIDWNVITQTVEQLILGEDVIQFGRRWDVPVSLLCSFSVESVRTQSSL